MLCDHQKNNLAKLQTQYDFQQLRPLPQVYQITHPECEHFQPTSDRRRRIYYKVQYEPKQQQAIEQTKRQLKNRGLTSHRIHDEVILKHVYCGKWDTDKVVERLRQLIEFQSSEKTTSFTAETVQKLTKGQLYTYGHDKHFRPNVVMRVDKFDLNLPLEEHFNAFYYLMLVVLGYRMVPYHAQKYNFFVDLNNISLTDLPLKYLYRALEKTDIYFCGKAEKTFVFNAEGMGNIWKLVSFFLPENQKKRVIFVAKGQEHLMLDYIEASQLQRKYGGKLPDLTEYWPPRDPKELQGKLDLSIYQQEFYSVNNDEGYFNVEGENTEIGTEGNCQCRIY